MSKLSSQSTLSHHHHHHHHHHPPQIADHPHQPRIFDEPLLSHNPFERTLSPPPASKQASPARRSIFLFVQSPPPKTLPRVAVQLHFKTRSRNPGFENRCPGEPFPTIGSLQRFKGPTMDVPRWTNPSMLGFRPRGMSSLERCFLVWTSRLRFTTSL